jgi:uncharacterized protein YecT (DUF1311 family)
MLIRVSAIFLILFTTIAPECLAASFDCERATTQAEKIICGDKDLSSLDDELNAAYKADLESLSDKKTLKDSQRKWIKEERDRCNDVQTMADAYRKRINELKSSVPQGTKKLAVNGVSNEIEKKYPPYPEVWGIDMPVYGASPRFDHVAKMADGDYFFSYVKERKGELGTALETYKHAWIKIFDRENKEFEINEYGETDKKIRDEKRQIEWSITPTITFSDGSSITTEGLLGRCDNPYEMSLRKKDKTGKVTAEKLLLYLCNQPVKTNLNTMCERNWGNNKDYYFKKVDNMKVQYFIPLDDDTFLVVLHSPESVVVLRFDKDFNTKSDLMRKNIFMIDIETAYHLYNRQDIAQGDVGSSDVLYEYLLKLKKEK